MSARKDRNPLFGAAVLRRTFELRRAEQTPQFDLIYQGVLRDEGLTDAQVEAYLREHASEVDAAIAGHRRGEGS